MSAPSRRTYWISAAVMMVVSGSTGAGIILVAIDLLGAAWAVLVLPLNVAVGIAIGCAWGGWLYSRRTGTWPPLRFYRTTFLATLRFIFVPGRFLPDDDRGR